MFSFDKFKLSNFIFIEIEFYFLISIKVIFAAKFIDIKKLSNTDSIYFTVLDTGLFLYDFDNKDYSLIHQFNGNEFRIGSNNIVNLTELYYEYKAYIFCLVNENLFIFNEYTYKVLNYKINQIKPFQGYYYNIMPYKIENNNISFIIAFNGETTNLFFYYYNFDLNEELNEPKKIIFNDMNIQNKMIRCQINSYFTDILCFYYSKINNENYFRKTIFHIKDMIINKEQTNEIIGRYSNVINQIKLAISDNNKYFVCFTINSIPKCVINEKNSYEFKEIDCNDFGQSDLRYKTFYFKETDEFIFISFYFLTATILNNLDNSIKKCQVRIFSIQNYENNAFSLIYINGYKVINYTNFTNYFQYIDISVLEENKNIEYIEEIKNIFKTIISLFSI